MANIITGLRIILSFGLIFCPSFSIPFYIVYILCGITDIIDGPIARKLNTVSEFGSNLDTIADFIFVVIALLKVIPSINILNYQIHWIILIALIKVFNFLYGFINTKNFVVLHTKLDKLTGVLLFILPLTISFIDIIYSSLLVLIVAFIAALDESFLTIKNKIILLN